MTAPAGAEQQAKAQPASVWVLLRDGFPDSDDSPMSFYGVWSSAESAKVGLRDYVGTATADQVQWKWIEPHALTVDGFIMSSPRWLGRSPTGEMYYLDLEVVDHCA